MVKFSEEFWIQFFQTRSVSLLPVIAMPGRQIVNPEKLNSNIWEHEFSRECSTHGELTVRSVGGPVTLGCNSYSIILVGYSIIDRYTREQVGGKGR